MWRIISWLLWAGSVKGIGVNWGTQSSHPLSPSTVVQMLRDNGVSKVKLFGVEEGTLNALKNAGIQVMLGVQNDMLPRLAADMNAAEKWVSHNVSSYVNNGVNISYIAVGNEPFLKTLNGSSSSYQQSTFPALQNIQSALVKAGLGSQIKVTIPVNADAYQSTTGKPSGGDFRPDIKNLILPIIKFLHDNNSPITVNTYPFISLHIDPNFPINYAFFDGLSSPIIDGSAVYTNTLDANHDTLIWALNKNGFTNTSIIIGEIGWPTDGDINANIQYAKRFNQGLVNHVLSERGTPMRPGLMETYLFSLIDEDQKSISSGNFERHWGIFTFDGEIKYQMKIGNSDLVPAKGVRYLEKRWCVLKSSASVEDLNVGSSVSFACGNSDCTSLGYGSSCGDLDARGNISYAFNRYYQENDQDPRACGFSDLGDTTDEDPSMEICKFPIMIEVVSGDRKLGFSSSLFAVMIGIMFLFLQLV